MKNYTVALEDDTVGKVLADDINVGDIATVSLWDENGLPIEVLGVVVEILEEKELWQ